jgi:beta-lactam-binding protein with PASTA domain
VIRTRVFVTGHEPTQICREPTGPPEAAIPDVTGFPESEAVKLLESTGFKVQRLTEESNLYPPGRVVRQEPGPGVEVSAGTTVTIWVSETVKKKIPDVVGMSDNEAISALENEGYAVLVDREDGCPKGSDQCRVSSQDPSGGTRASEGTEVTIFVTKKD